MAEIGIIASIIGVAGAGFRLSLILNAVGSEVASAGLEIHSISKGITLFSLMLKQVGQTLQAPDSVHTREAEQAAKHITDECQLVFDEIQYLLDRCRTRRNDGSFLPTTIQKFKWCFKKHKVQYLLGQLESLKLSLSVMLQILQLGKLLAAPLKSERPEAAARRNDAIQQERVETQNIIIVRYWQIDRLDRLYDQAQQEEKETQQAEIAENNQAALGTDAPQLTLEAPPDHNEHSALIKLPSSSFGDLDELLEPIKETPKDMLQASNRVIDPLLDRWTHWKDVRPRNQSRESWNSVRFAPSVQDLEEEDEKGFKQTDVRDHDDGPRGVYLEGPTVDWRHPHSVAAKQEAARRRQQYSHYQPSVSAEGSDVEDGRDRRRPDRHVSHHHVVDSSSESSESDFESESDHTRPQRRRSSGSPTTEKKPRLPEGPSMAHTYGPQRSNFGGRHPAPPMNPAGPVGSIMSSPRSAGEHRPNPTPVQNAFRHSLSSPVPPIHTSNAPNPYAPQTYQPQGPYSPGGAPQHYMLQSGLSHVGNRYGPPPPPGQRMPIPPRPGSQDGKRRSPSRQSTSSQNRPITLEEKAAMKAKKDRDLAKSATKGILGAGSLAMFLEALEGLDV